MPIRIDLHDNSSEVKVRPRGKDQVEIKSGCNITNKVQDAKINKEIQDRIIADKNLQSQLDQKQDEIKFVAIQDFVGTLQDYELELLKKSLVNKVKFQNSYYRLSFKDGNIRKYFTASQATVYNEVDIDMSTGNYWVIQKVDPVLEAHINDADVHVTPAERIFWNNKVTAEVNQIEEEDYNLSLRKN